MTSRSRCPGFSLARRAAPALVALLGLLAPTFTIERAWAQERQELPAPAPPKTPEVPPLPPPLAPPTDTLPPKTKPPATHVPPLAPALGASAQVPPLASPQRPPMPAAPPPLEPAPVAPSAAPQGVPPLPAAPPPIAGPPPLPTSPPKRVDPCARPAGHRGAFKPPPHCAKKKPPSTKSHSGQFIFQLGAIEMPYLFAQVTDRSLPDDRRHAWLPTLGLGWASGLNETLFKFGAGVQRYAADTTFTFGIERRRYFGTGTLKGIFAWNLLFSAGGALPLHQLFNIALGVQVDPSRRWGAFLTFGPGFVSTWGGGQSDASFILHTLVGVQVRI